MKGNKKTFTKKKSSPAPKRKTVVRTSSPQTPTLPQPPAAPVSNTQPVSSVPIAPSNPVLTPPPPAPPPPPPPTPAIESVAESTSLSPSEHELTFDSSEGDLSPNDKKNYKFFILGCFALLLIIILTAVIPWLLSQEDSQQTTVLPTPTEKQATTELTPKSLNKSDWTFEVLNGSGTAGKAGKTAEQIRGLGFTVVSIGNADKSTYTTTQVFIKSALTDQQDLLLKELQTALPSASFAGELKDSTASAQIIVGKE